MSRLQMPRMKITIYGVGVLFALAIYVGLTLGTIAKFSIWHDESYSATLIENNYQDIVERTSNDVHPPFYYLSLKSWSYLVGDSVVSLRLFSMICMLGAILIAWAFFKKVYGPRAGLAALFGMSVGSFLIRYGQEMRMYALGALLASASTSILWTVMSRPKKNYIRLMLGYSLLMAMAIYTHYFLVFLLLAHSLFVIWQINKGQKFKGYNLLTFVQKIPKTILLGLVMPIILFVPWINILLAQFREVQGAFWIGPLKVEDVTSTIINFFSFMKQWELESWTAVYGVVVILATMYIFWKWFSTVRSKEQKAATQLIGLMFLIPLIMLIVVSLPPMQPAYQDRYLTFYAPFLYGVFGIALAEMFSRPLQPTKFIAGLFGTLAILIGVISVSLTGNNQGWRPNPHFTMQKITNSMMSIEPNSEVVSTTLWTFFDVHILMKDCDVKLYAPNGVGKYGNASAVNGRDELVLHSLDDVSSNVWLVEEAGQEELSVPQTWHKGERIQAGYARATHYTIK